MIIIIIIIILPPFPLILNLLVCKCILHITRTYFCLLYDFFPPYKFLTTEYCTVVKCVTPD